MTNQTKWHTCAPSEGSDQPGHPESSLSARIKLGSLDTNWAHSEESAQTGRIPGLIGLWSDWEDAQADLGLRWTHMSFCWLCHKEVCFLGLISVSDGRWGTTYDVATVPFIPFVRLPCPQEITLPLQGLTIFHSQYLFIWALVGQDVRESANPNIPVHSLMLLIFCLPLLVASFTVPCRTVSAMPEDLEMWPFTVPCRAVSAMQEDLEMRHFTVPCRTVSAMPEDLETWPYLL